MNFKLLITDKRFILIVIGVLLLASSFWLLSRYPALGSKALMAGSIGLEDGLSFDALFPNSSSFNWLQTSLTTYLNWLNSNKQGMLFGLGFAVLLMSLLALLRPLLTVKSGSLRSSFTGFLIGTPLGICVNCAAPVAFGMYKKGVRIETALSTMVSAPTLNIIVLSMAFSLFPVHVVVVKIMLTLLCIFVVIPMIARLFAEERYSKDVPDSVRAYQSSPEGERLDHDFRQWKAAFSWALKEVGRNTWYVARQVIPLMLLAGLLGSIVVTLLPWYQLYGYLPSGGELNPLAMLLVAVFGLFLPVPIAFDVVVAAILLNAGVPMKYVATLLFVLGSFSIYSYFVLIRAGAKKLAHSLALALILMGVLAGFTTHYLDKLYQSFLMDQYYSTLQDDASERHHVATLTPMELPVITPPKLTWKALAHHPNISMLSMIEPPSNSSKPWMMQKVKHSGLQIHPKPLIQHRLSPFNHAYSISSGDINQDEWLDIVVGTGQGLFLYINTGIGFKLVAMPALAVFNQPIGAIALADINNDGWVDLLFSVYRKGEYVAYNHHGVFQSAQLIHASDSLFALALAVGDIDHNGELDVIAGYNNGVGWGFQSPVLSKNHMLLQQGGKFTESTLPGIAGETLSILLSDINQDTYLDLLVGNDYEEPDSFYWGAEHARWISWDKTNIDAMTQTTMSIDSADFNNDLRLDTYHAQITRNPASPPARIRQKDMATLVQEECDRGSDQPKCQELLSRDICRPFGDLTNIEKLRESYRLDCVAANVFLSGIHYGAERFNGYLSKHYPDIQYLYDHIFSLPKAVELTLDEVNESISQVESTNLLFVQDPGGHLYETSGKLHADIAGWAWNAKFADLDGDTFQDLFVVNGWEDQRFATENVWFKNYSGERFVNQSLQVGLDAFDVTLSYSYIDYDNDGDLDIVTFSASGELMLYKNHHNANRHIQIELDDHIGNRSGIGAIIIIHYGSKQELHQLREIKASGGYLSIDPPIAHFGLGRHQYIDSIDVRWSTGEKQHFAGSFQAGMRYRITRQKNSSTKK